ncbi:MAG: PD-(D/E)XK nuclease family protein [Lachnospiraceae bacterium]
MEKNFEEQGKMDEAKVYHQIYGTVISLFDKLVEFLGDEVMSLKDYKELLEAGFEDSRVGLIPPSLDEVLVGDMERTRLKNIKVLIFLGLNEGIVPSAGKGGGILSEEERSFLSDQGVTLAPGTRENSFVERFYLYLHLTKPSERLYLTMAKADLEGKAMRPSYVVGRIQRLFPELSVTDEEADQSFKNGSGRRKMASPV